jgi:hypothetical protein
MLQADPAGGRNISRIMCTKNKKIEMLERASRLEALKSIEPGEAKD